MPLVLAGRDGRRRVLLAVDEAAQGIGLYVGMPATKAQALVGDLIIQDAQLAADAEALERLALWALRRYSPVVAVDAPDGLVIDATGAAHLFGGEEAMLADLLQRVNAVGIRARAAMADSWGAAHGLARFRKLTSFIAPPNETARNVEPLPIAALRIAFHLVKELHKLGFETIGDLAKTPRAPLTLRFGPELGRRLDQALAKVGEPIDPVRSPEIIEVRQSFGEPIGAAETISRYISKLVSKLCTALEERGLGVRRLDLLCHRVDNRIEAARIGTAQAIRDAKRLIKLLAPKIETIDPGFGIEMMCLVATVAEELRPKQQIASLAEEPDADVTNLIDTLANRIGEQHLYRLSPVPSDIPERCVRRIAPTEEPDAGGWPDHWPRPSRLLPHPELIETVALLPDHPPVSFTWRGTRRRVKRADGPERVFGEWWKADPELAAVRDYFRIEDETGERYWIYRAGDGEDAATGSHRWFLHGIFG